MLPQLEIRSQRFRRAILDIERRAERQAIDEKLVKTFVPNKVLDELETTSNQLLFGRRGVGKTHTLKALLGRLTTEGALCSYIDCTSFGSGIGSEGSPLNVGIRFFSSFLRQLASNILDIGSLTREELQNIVLACAATLDELAIPKTDGDTFDYQKIINLLTEFLKQIGADRFYILVDEWANIPKTAQPYFGEFMKRSLFANKFVTVKIGVVDYTYSLSQYVNGNLVGLERSADIFSDVRMDTFFVWDRHESFVEQFFSEVIYNHLGLELDLPFDLPPAEKFDFIIPQLFTQANIFAELCRASEGNARDLLVLLGKSHARFAQQEAHQHIGLDDVHGAAIDLYRSDKLSNLASEKGLEEFLDYLVNSIIREKKSRTFMVPYEYRSHPLLLRLFSARILHPLEIEWSHQDKPGERYSLITMDYGTYASFKGTKNAPIQPVMFELELAKPAVDDLVPFDDRRSIRRIVVEPEVLDRFQKRWEESRTP